MPKAMIRSLEDRMTRVENWIFRQNVIIVAFLVVMAPRAALTILGLDPPAWLP